MIIKPIAVSTLALSLGLSPMAFAQEEAAPAVETVVKDAREHSVNLNPLGVISNNYTLNYERLFGGTHGLLVEPSFGYASDSDSSSTAFGLDLGYRWHWSGEQDSGFLGVNVGYSVGSGEATVTVNDISETFDVDVSQFRVLANIGRRWAFDFGLNITARIGAGYGDWSVSTDSTNESAQQAVKMVDTVLEFLPFAFDGELSLGWIF